MDCPGAPAELNESPREEPGRKTAGELISCPFCLSVWLVTTLTGARAVRPEATRTVTGALTALTVSDALQYGVLHAVRARRPWAGPPGPRAHGG
ncbi:DUF1360 domain-containing protein [Streptomyces sp. A0592]|uniref:DUF1360 domain-containing protein n=1 Tax=Streptomyces sp. A0592 TaxID=2563099 RepID=UPI001F1049FD|nr:DUF1360 domain-containing protein [Streptomyces sp. A0592]